MIVIFSGSADSSSFEHSSRILGPFIRWLSPHISEEKLKQIVFIMRKGAHMTEYAILVLLLWRALKKNLNHGPVADRSALWAWSIAVAYACTDEFHQSFVPTREASIWDVCIDAAGAIIAIGLVKFVVRFRNQHRPRRKE
jgi:VanZ family protein